MMPVTNCNEKVMYMQIWWGLGKPDIIVLNTTGQTDHISCTWLVCATFVDRSARVDIFCFLSAPPPPQKNTLTKNLLEDIEYLLPVTFHQIPFSSSRLEVENVSANQTPSGHLGFQISQKNTNLVEVVEILLSVKFCWILFSRFREEIKNVSTS